ncbi:MAG: DUF3277 family protein [Chitinispirillales bacterium]|jgi:hypothetical protein|nr:DUF3277 family protein [Chitinispirillales bacterium]
MAASLPKNKGLYSFDPSQVSVIIGGVEMSGFSDGTFIEVSLDGDDWELISGADGDVVRAKKQNRVSTLSLTLLQSSHCNDILSAWRIIDKTTLSGAVAILIRDKSGRTVISAAFSFVLQPPTVSFSDGVERRTWNIAMIDASLSAAAFFVGGNIKNTTTGGSGQETVSPENIPALHNLFGGETPAEINADTTKTIADLLTMLGGSVSETNI